MLGDTLTELRRLPRETAVVVGLISSSQFINHMYLVLLPPILTILAGDFRVTLALLGVALGVQALTNTLFQLPFGCLADHFDRTIALGLSSFLGAIGMLVLAVAPSFAWLLVGQAIVGIGIAGHHPAHYPLLTDATPESVRGRAFSVYKFGGMLRFATPPVVITAIIAVPGLTWRHAVGLLGVLGLVYAALVTAVFATRLSREITEPNLADVDRTDGLLATSLVPAAVAIGLFLLVGAIRSLEGPARDTLTERLASDGTVGKSFAIITIGIMIGSAVAPPVFGYLIERFDVGIAFYAVAAVAVVATLLTVAMVVRLDGDSAPTPAPSE